MRVALCAWLSGRARPFVWRGVRSWLMAVRVCACVCLWVCGCGGGVVGTHLPGTHLDTHTHK